MYNVDIILTLQLISHCHPESDTTQFIDKVIHVAVRNNMTPIAEHCYAVGSQQQQALH